MEGQSIDDMTAYAIGKLQGGWSHDQVAASIREMLAAEQWPASAIELMLAQVATRVNKQKSHEAEMPANQSDPSVIMMDMLRQMMNRIDTLENRTLGPASTPPTRASTPPQAAASEKRVKFPDPEKFDGDRSRYAIFRYQARAKLEADYRSCSEKAQVDYVFQRCIGNAAKVLLPWIVNQPSPSLQGLWSFMDLQFDDPHQKTKAMDQLSGIRQGKRPVREYLIEFNRLVQLTGETFGDTNKKNLFVRGLNIELQRSTIAIAGDTTYEVFSQEVVRIADILYRTNLASRSTRTRGHVLPSQEKAAPLEAMDWQPTTTSNQSATKMLRAKWVPKAEIQRRKDSGLCMRCGASGHYASKCPYQAPRPPSPVQAASTATTQAQIPPLLEEEHDAMLDSGKE